ncbi:hypothetical protein E4T50_13039 [Aureobasidium sp. EXF-12298]|nr:hypothetical protein E4T50_13039 [Aureobasidium sp. EXF-12298]
MRCHILTVLATLAATAIADVKFSSPAAGQQVAGGTSITITWKDDGTAPTIDQFASYTLNLMAGGNTAATATSILTLGTGAYSGTTGSLPVVIPVGLGKTATNGYFLQMISTGVDGGTDIVYSARFGLTGMTGVLTAAQLSGITAAGSDTTFVPPAAHNLVTAAAGTAAAAPVTGMFDVPYLSQTGFIKYAPMQPIPGTKITKKTASMMNPSSAFTIFKTYAPPASITYTLTESQTLTHSSRENPASAATQPTAADMKKYLNRWKD